MKRSTAVRADGPVVALALTWDGVRVSLRNLPWAARKFLGPAALRVPDAASLGALFAQDGVKEIRVCWVPRLEGGDRVMAAPFSAPRHRRLGFRRARLVTLGDVIGVIYRRAKA
jgi:hypothetical protein